MVPVACVPVVVPAACVPVVTTVMVSAVLGLAAGWTGTVMGIGVVVRVPAMLEILHGGVLSGSDTPRGYCLRNTIPRFRIPCRIDHGGETGSPAPWVNHGDRHRPAGCHDDAVREGRAGTERRAGGAGRR